MILPILLLMTSVTVAESSNVCFAIEDEAPFKDLWKSLKVLEKFTMQLETGLKGKIFLKCLRFKHDRYLPDYLTYLLPY